MDVGERSIMIHHAMPTANCNTSNTRVFDPFKPPTSGSQHLLAPHLIHGTVEQRIHVLLLLLTNLPLDGVAATGGYVGDLQMQDTGYLTSVSMDGEYTFSTFSERREWLLRASATPLLMGRLQEAHRGFSCLIFDHPPALASTVAAL